MKQLPNQMPFCSFAVTLLLVLSGFSFNASGQVNLQTGSATFSLPMFNWQDHKSNLNTVVALSYNSGNGLKVNDLPSNVGQGWNLIAGGVITRIQIGEPDDQIAYGTAFETDLRKYPNGYLYAATKAYKGCPEPLTKYPIYKYKNQLYKQPNPVTEDRELDQFAFQFNGKSGVFVINTAPQLSSGDDPGPDIGTTLGDSKLKITFQRDPGLLASGIRTTITSFKIQDEDGLIYTFAKHNISRLLKTKYCDKYVTYKKDQPTFKAGEVYHQTDFITNEIDNDKIISGWHLTEIKDPLTQRVVTLTYSMQSVSVSAGADFSYNYEKNYSIVTHRKSVYEQPVLESIAFPDGHSVVFHNGITRRDVLSGKALSAVDIKYNGRFISKYLLKMTYFILNRYGTPVSDYQKKVSRLCLKSVQKIGVDLKEDSPPYVFDYFTGSNNPNDVVPPPFSHKKDIWGYYNGEQSIDYNEGTVADDLAGLTNYDIRGLCFMRHNRSGTVLNPRAGYAKNGSLKQIIYPTGGTLSYEYQQNTGLIRGQEQAVGGVHVSQTASTDGGGSNGCGNPIVTAYNYVLGQPGNPSSLWGIEEPKNKVAMTSYYEPKERKYKPALFGGGLFGSCYYKYKYPGILSLDQATNLSQMQEIMAVLTPVLGLAGQVSTALNIAKIAAGPTGAGLIISVAIDVIVAAYTVISTCFGNPNKTVAATVYYTYDLNAISPLPLQFKRVEVVENPGTTGKTVHEFTNDSDYPVWEPVNTALSSKQRFASWDYGLPSRTIVFNAAGDTVKQTINEYDGTEARRRISNLDIHYITPELTDLRSKLVSCKCNVKNTYSQKNDEWESAAPVFKTSSPDMDIDRYTYYTGRRNLIKTIEKTYRENDPLAYVESVTSYQYNPDNFEVSRITTVASNGDVTTKHIFYASQWSSDPVHLTMSQNNILSVPVSTETTFIPAGGGPGKTLSLARTVFTQLPNGAIKPWKLYERSFAAPADYTTANNTPERLVKLFTYDSQGNLTGVKDEGGRVVTNLYDYDDKYVSATVINADAATGKTFYTSFETPATGGWAVGGTAAYSTANAATGNRGLNLAGSGGVSASGLSAGQDYRLSFWSTGTVSVAGASSTSSSGPTIGGLTYYEYAVPANQTTVSLSGPAVIDELRLYPQKARMSTVTYDPLIGKTSECDQNNRIIYYEYDNLGRMRFIKDEKRNIVKMFEYNNVSRQTGCPAVFYSRYTVETFQKNNCPAGYVGGSISYTIPADKYSSTISQEDADAKVESELLEYGQAFANANAPCLQVYYNAAVSQTFTRESCGDGYIGSNVTYTVPAGRYSSTISQGEVDTLALEDIEANGEAYANHPDSGGTCTINYNPIWEYGENPQTQCQTVNGQNHLFVLATDENPNSSTYGQTSWKDLGYDSNCPQPTGCVINYANSAGESFYLKLKNTTTQEEYYFYAQSGMTGELGTLPSGAYSLEVTYYSYGQHTLSICSDSYAIFSGTSYLGYITVNCGGCSWNFY